MEEWKDCLQCRLTGGGGLMAAGAYVLYQSKKVKKSRPIVTAFGYGLCALGILRIFSLPPFGDKTPVEKKDSVEKIEQNDYIIGKYPPKLH